MVPAAVAAAMSVALSNLLVSFHLANTSPKAKAGRDVPTMADNPIPLRVVIQQLGTYPVPNYRVIVYGDELKPMHSDFGSAALLLEALRCAVPGLDVSQRSLNPLQERQGSIVFDGELLLTAKQLSVLGLTQSRQNG